MVGCGGQGASDTVRVREVLLGNGQKATVIMEEGRIKRIVAANGQVAELRWQSIEPKPNSNEGRLPLTVNLMTGSGQYGPLLDTTPGYHILILCLHLRIMHHLDARENALYSWESQ